MFGMDRTIMHVDLDAFYVGVELATRPDLKGLPVIVGGSPGSRGVVLSASYEARQYGVDSGIPAARAGRLCPQAIFLRPNFKTYVQASKKFMAILREFSPRVEPTSLDEAYIDYTGCEPLHGPVRQAAEKLRKEVLETIAVTASVGIGPSRVVAKVASAAAKPDGVIYVAPGDEAAFLGPLHVRKLPGIGPKAQANLERLGIKTLGQLAELSDEFLRRQFGTHGPGLRLRAAGIDGGSIHEGRPANHSISKSVTLGADTRDRVELRRIMLRHAGGVAAQARRHVMHGRTVTLRLRFNDFTNVTRSVTLNQPTASEDVIYKAAAELLEAELDRDPRPVRLVGVALTNFVDAAQLDLFGRQAERAALDSALDDLKRRFGSGAVRRGLYAKSDAD